MNIIQKQPNPSGGYPGHRSCEGALPDGHAIIPDALNMVDFYAHNGFVTLVIEGDTVTDYAPNIEAWEAWEAEEAARVLPIPNPTLEERTTALEATQSDVIDVLASALGVTI